MIFNYLSTKGSTRLLRLGRTERCFENDGNVECYFRLKKRVQTICDGLSQILTLHGSDIDLS